MFRMAVGHSDDIDLDAALATVFGQCEAALDGAKPRAGLLMAAWEADHQSIVDAVRTRYPGIELAGSTTAGEMSSVLGFQEDSIALTLFASDTVEITAGLGPGLRSDARAATQAAVDQARAKATLDPSLCIAMPAIGLGQAGEILAGLRAALGKDVPILGGGAAHEDPSQNPADGVSRQVVDDTLAEGAIAILLFSGPLDFSFGVETGWRGVGQRATVDRSSPEGVLEIGGRPAVEFYDRYLGHVGQPPIANPLAVFEGETPDFYLRTPTNFDRDTGLIGFLGFIPEGATVQITVAATDEIVDGARASIADALASFPGGRTPDGALLYSCVTRRFLLGTRAGREIEQVREELGSDVPVAGFYCVGEIAPMPLADGSQFHNATMVAVLLGAT
ncbi:MAG TPA: FIST C-terminal domain-containing protein [Actinomycetota bacterium]